MYTLEDDQETSSRLRRSDFANPSIAPTDASNASSRSSVGRDKSGPYALPRPSLGAQVTGSFKKLTTPAQGRDKSGPYVSKGFALTALAVACIAVFFTALDQTVVVTALPQIITDLQIPIIQLDHAAWIISAYLLGFVIAMPLMGRVSDIYGRRRIFLLCLTIFGIGSILCGLAPIFGQLWDISFLNVLHIDTSSPGLVWLIAARFFQAIGGGAVVPVAMAIVGDFYGQERRSLALGVVGGITEAGGALGPLYGALIVQHFGWQWIFYFNVPIVIGLIAAAWFLIPKKGTHLREGIDWIGAILLGLALTCLSLGLAQQGTDLGPSAVGSTPQNNPISLALAAVFLLAFILVERKVRWPVVDLSLFKRFPFSATSLVSLFVGAALIIAMADIPIFVDTVLQRPVLDSGLALLRLTAMIPVGALLGGWLSSRISCRLTGILGLLFTAVGFYLMSRWPLDVGWNQITISAMTAGLGFGLVIAPIGTTAINAVKATQAGTGSAVVTALRMVGMMLGLAALTSWALAYFKQLASTYPSLPTTATSDQFAQWSQGYAHHLIISAHTVYSAVFFTSMILCLIAIIPAIFLWGREAPQEDQEGIVVSTTSPLQSVSMNQTATPPDPALVAVGTPLILPGAGSAGPPNPPTPNGSGGWRNVFRNGNWRNVFKGRRRLLIAIISIALVLLLMSLGIFAALTWESTGTASTNPSPASSNSAPATPGPGTPTPIAGPRMIQLALDQTALTSLFAAELGLNQGVLTDLRVVPTPNDGLILSLNLHIDANGIHRVLPVELDSTIGIDAQQNIQLHIFHLKRDGLDAGPTAAASMQRAMNQLLVSSVMPALRGQLKSAKLISVHTSSSTGCTGGGVMLVLLIQAPPIQGIAAQPTPTTLCLNGPINLNKLLG